MWEIYWKYSWNIVNPIQQCYDVHTNCLISFIFNGMSLHQAPFTIPCVDVKKNNLVRQQVGHYLPNSPITI